VTAPIKAIGASTSPEGAGARDRILLIEDDPAFRLSLRGLLEGDFELETASDLKRGLAVLARRPSAVVITDFQLPDGTGLDILDYARERLPGTITILLTGDTSRPEVVNIRRDRQAFLVIPKTIAPAELLKRVKNAFSMAKLRDARLRLSRPDPGGPPSQEP
jgi:two-component system, NtrC family, response regulator HydG